MKDTFEMELNGKKLVVDLKDMPHLREVLSDEVVPPAKEWTRQDEEKYLKENGALPDDHSDDDYYR